MRRALGITLIATTLIAVSSGPGSLPSAAQEPPPVVEVPAGGDIQAAATAAGPGATLQLDGSYVVTSPIAPLDGQTFLGPATLVGQGVSFVFRNTGVGVTYDGLDISGATGLRASAIQLGVGGTVRNSVLHDNGWNGVRGQFHDGPANITLIDVELYGNGFDPDALGQGAGGYKFLNGDGLTTVRVYAHDNIGMGGWLDQDWGAFTSTDDVYVRNSQKGLFYEVSLGPALIERVTATDNAQTGVQVSSSEHVVVRHATVGGTGNGRGVVAADISAQRTDRYSRPLLDVVFETSTFSMNGDAVIGCGLRGVTCDPRVSVSLAGDGSGTVTSSPAGIACAPTCSAWFARGVPVTLDAWPDPGSGFAGWAGACTGSDPCQLTPAGDADVTATFRALEQLSVSVVEDGRTGTVTSVPAGIDCAPACAATFPRGTQVELVAAPEPDAVVAWAGCVPSVADPARCTATLDGPVDVTATFRPTPHALTVSTTGAGTVTSSPAGIDCGATCAASFPTGTSVTLSASPAAGHTFGGWGGDCSGTDACTVTMDQARSVSASFDPVPRLLSVTVGGAGFGAVTSAPAGIDCGVGCSASFPHGTEVTLTPTAEPGSVFAGWGGACSGTGPCVVAMDADRSADATFALAPPSVTLDEGDPSIRYQGWQGRTDPAASGGSYRVSSTKGELATWVSPAVTSLTWVARVGPDRGKASVTIDGAAKGTVDLYAATPGSVSTTYANLGSSPHTVVIKVLGTKRSASSGTGVTIDAFVAGGTTVEDPSPQVAYASWAGVAEPAATGNAIRRSATKNATAVVTFTGTRVDWVSAVGPAYGKANVVIDGVNRGTFDLYASAPAWQRAFTFGGLSPGAHTMTIKVLGQKRAASTGTAVVVDGFVIHG